MSAKPWLEHYDAGVPASLEPYPERTLLDFLAEAARTHPDRPVALFKGRRLTYAELERRSDECAAAFAAIGVRPGERLALCLPNIPQFLVAQLGAWKAGATVCPFNPTYTEREIEDALTTTGAETLVVMNRYYPKVKRVQPRTSVRRIVATNVKEYLPPLLALAFTLLKEKREGDRITLADGDYRLTKLLASHRGAAPPAVRVAPDDPAVILMSGGTTGTPKGVVGSHRGMVMSGLQLQSWLRSTMLEWTDTFMLPLPLFHTYANSGGLSLALVNHNPIVLVPNPRDLSDVLAEIARTRPSFLVAVPTLITGLLDHPRTRGGRVAFDCLKLCFSGAAPLMVETTRRWEQLTGGVIMEGYSLTEALMAVVANPIRGTKKPGSVGMPLPDVEVRILDADDADRELPQGEVGEIAIAAPQVMSGYWLRDEDTRAVIREGDDGRRLLLTGDLGYLDPDGYLFIVDRKKDLIKTGGFQVWPREVEEVLASHPAVAECGVAGLPDVLRGEIVKAWVVLRPGRTATAGELKAFCRERLAPYKVPSRWEFVPELPKNMIGKVLRRILRQGEAPPAQPVGV